MASIICGGFSVDYNITDGEPREVFINNVVIYRTPDEAARTRPPENVAVETDGWQTMLAKKFVALGLNKRSPLLGGYHAVAFWLEERGLVVLEP